jgi:dienelactone hydrolase
MRENIEFTSSGLTLRGWLYRPDGIDEPSPAIVMSHGFSAVKEQGLASFAERFVAAGFLVVAFDHRHLGASDGAERGRIVFQEQHDDTRAALTWLAQQPGVDGERVGLWGSSYSGGHAVVLGALDPRVKCVVAQVPALDIVGTLMAVAGRDGFLGLLGPLADDHARRNIGEPSAPIPVVGRPGEQCVLPTPDAYEWFMSTVPDAPNWLNQTTLESVARAAEYKPAAFIDLIAPKPLLIVAAVHDSLIPIEQVRDAAARAGEPKKLIEFDCQHCDVYPGRSHHEAAADAATEWFTTHLASRVSA